MGGPVKCELSALEKIFVSFGSMHKFIVCLSLPHQYYAMSICIGNFWLKLSVGKFHVFFYIFSCINAMFLWGGGDIFFSGNKINTT